MENVRKIKIKLENIWIDLIRGIYALYKMRGPLKEAVKIFEARLQSKTWDIHGMPHFVTTMHCEGCDTCEAYALHVVEASRAVIVFTLYQCSHSSLKNLNQMYYLWYS